MILSDIKAMVRMWKRVKGVDLLSQVKKRQQQKQDNGFQKATKKKKKKTAFDKVNFNG